jgi:hypothetical protein
MIGSSFAQGVASLESLVRKEGFAPVPSQSDVYKPGSILIKNSYGGYDLFLEDCFKVEPSINIMSQSSIAQSLSAGVSANIIAGRGRVDGSIQKRVSYIDPEQRSIPLSEAKPTDQCIQKVNSYSSAETEMIWIYDVLAARVKSSVCRKLDASGKVIALTEAEVNEYSECIQESDAIVPIGFKYKSIEDMPFFTQKVTQSNYAVNNVDFVAPSFKAPKIAVDELLKKQECDIDGRRKVEVYRKDQISEAKDGFKSAAEESWSSMYPDLNKCLRLKKTERESCIEALDKLITYYRSLDLYLPAQVISVQTDCGPYTGAASEYSEKIKYDEIEKANLMLSKLKKERSEDAVDKRQYYLDLNGRNAIENGNGEVWYKNGQLHREDGPAIKDVVYKTAVRNHRGNTHDLIVVEPGSEEWWLNGVRHRVGGPAITYKDGSKKWYRNGVLSREDGPAVEPVVGPGNWYLVGRRHREDGPALYLDGNEYWYYYGNIHREDGPAVTYRDGTKMWYEMGVRHRIGGPAIELPDGKKYWYVDGKEYSYREYCEEGYDNED